MFERCHITTILVLALTGCDKTPKPVGLDVPSSMPASASSGPTGTRHPKQLPLAGEHVEIPTGTFEAGTLPGTEGRHPEVEQQLTNVELGHYSIDRLLYPNDPNSVPLTNISRVEAATRCAERSARLCTELEWERACKGPKNDNYSTGTTFDAQCSTSANACASGYDVLGLGTTLREWTASDSVTARGATNQGAIVRGAAASAAAPEHRCAKREVVKENDRFVDVGFRCCHGPPNAARVEEPVLSAVFERPTLDPKKLGDLLSADPRTKALAKDWTLFREPDAAETVVSRGPGDRQGLRFTVAPLIWSPVAGTRFLLIVGRSGKETSAVLAYHVIRDGDYRLAASFVMKNELGPVALAYHESIRPRLFFSTCWKCPGETGRILYRNPDAVTIVQP